MYIPRITRIIWKKIFLVLIVFLIIGCAAKKEQKTGIPQETITATLPEDNEGSSPELPMAQDSLDEEKIETANSGGISRSISYINTSRLLSLPPNGVYVAELNPANYQKINQNSMEAMGMAPYYVAFLAGEKLYRDGDYDMAISEYSRTISLKSDYADAFASRGNAQRRKGDVNKAIEDYSRALALKRDYTEIYNYRGFMYANRGDLRRAIDDYTQAIRYKPDYTDAYFNRAHAHAKLGNWDLSIADYTQVIKLEPANWVAYHQRGNAWYSKGDKSKAADDYDSAERLK